METITIEAIPGMDISTACKNAVAMANEKQCNVAFDFNRIDITATPTTNAEALAESYMEGCRLRHEAYMASPERKAEQEAAEKKESDRKAIVANFMSARPDGMTLRDPDGWHKACEANKDGYGGAVMSYAERWAGLMEARMAKGEKLEDIADECSHLADEEGITGFMYGCAVSTLAQVWSHGEQLRRWHNKETQLGTEGDAANESGGVLNTALLNIG